MKLDREDWKAVQVEMAQSFESIDKKGGLGRARGVDVVSGSSSFAQQMG